jgi:hypothetical protein
VVGIAISAIEASSAPLVNLHSYPVTLNKTGMSKESGRRAATRSKACEKTRVFSLPQNAFAHLVLFDIGVDFEIGNRRGSSVQQIAYLHSGGRLFSRVADFEMKSFNK